MVLDQETIIELVEVLRSMYTDEELFISAEDDNVIDTHNFDRPISIRLTLEVVPSYVVEVTISLGVNNASVNTTQPGWMNRKRYECLRQSCPPATDDDDDSFNAYLFEYLDYISQFCSDEVGTSSSPTENLEAPPADELLGNVIRTWNLFPSLSTKEKRQDLVTYGQSYRPPMTGIVLAGKPGLVILEHPSSADIDEYWSNIKSRSWADIPASHKKVSERLREDGVVRAFDDMKEITADGELGGREAIRGGNRNDLGQLTAWLARKGLDGRLPKVLGMEL